MAYQYTKPRVPIAAMYQSPGPCYVLPYLVGHQFHDPRSVHNRGPAYSFGTRHGETIKHCSPGPCYLLTPKIYRDGPDGTPHYSLAGHLKGLTTFNNPGPGSHSPEKSGPSSKFMSPQYSFGTRHRLRRTDNTPAPNAYSLPMMGDRVFETGKRQPPSYSLTGRSNTGSFLEDVHKTPGPGTYQTTDAGIYREKGPIYSMTSRNFMPGDSTLKPGPGAHSPEKVTVNKKTLPSFSFGIRHTEYLTPFISEVPE